MADYISREAAIALTDQHCFESNYDALWMEDELRDLPAADVRTVARGRWLQSGKYNYHYICSVCREPGPLDLDESVYESNFCPNCGADMRQTK